MASEQRVWHGLVRDWSDLDRLCHEKLWPYENDAFPPERVHRATIDMGKTGARTMEVYGRALRRLQSLVPLKGASKARNDATFFWAR